MNQASADEITLRGTQMPLPPVQVQRIDSGRVAFLDPRGRMTRMNVREIRWIFFDDLPELQRAEEALDDGELDRGLMLLLQANLAATEPMHRLWTHLRLAQLHEDRGELIEAAGHLAAVVRLDDDSAWTRFEPLGEPLSTSIFAVTEARQHIQRARTGARDASVREMLDRMLERVERSYEALREDDPELRPEPGMTLSGYLVDALRDDALRRPDDHIAVADEDERGGKTGDEERKSTPTDDKPHRAPADDERSNQRIAELIEREQWRDALALCERVAQEPGPDRDLAEFLYQYGIALRENERQRDAAAMFMRSAIHYPDAHVAPLSLIEAATIARDELDNQRAARRMLNRAAAMITDEHDPLVQQRLHELMESLTNDVQRQ